ncbi:MAG: acyltransferase family protein [Clostridiales bacterium]|nr:acyltransferase family protein [Clostridiales bacterium]
MKPRVQGGARIEKWDLLRALLIFLVVLGHMVDYYTADSVRMRGLYLFIYAFHMPCFLFVDGLFSKRNVNERRYPHIFSFLVLYLFTKMLICLVQGIIAHEFSFSLLESAGLPWYALVLFLYNLVTIFLSRFSHRWVLIASVVLACFIGYDSNVGDTMALMRAIVFYPFFFAGYCLDPTRVAEKLSGKWIRIGGLLVLAALAVICFHCTDDFYFLRPLLTGRNRFSALGSYGQVDLAFFGGLIRLGYYAVVALLCTALIAVMPSHLPGGRVFTAIGRRTLQIYTLHRPILYVLYSGLHFDAMTAAAGVSNLVILPVAALLTIFCALPFWEKPIRAVIYPKLHRPEGGAD